MPWHCFVPVCPVSAMPEDDQRVSGCGGWSEGLWNVDWQPSWKLPAGSSPGQKHSLTHLLITQLDSRHSYFLIASRGKFTSIHLAKRQHWATSDEWLYVCSGSNELGFFLMVLKHCVNQQPQTGSAAAGRFLKRAHELEWHPRCCHLLENVAMSWTSRWLTATPGMLQSRNLAMQNKTKHVGLREWKTTTDS